ncbi:hypothetical protein [Cellulosimicrobium sp. Marseille-Q4280]|uniref:hypothetical protein n=1 Tax=Cellulosimicrobium sp. Marseille-Q4280 TaxID=2937992 RepID=UPI00203D8992|nr:hypothetical protein [Cellulosimicrobium sp. Marseille-Q4280]
MLDVLLKLIVALTVAIVVLGPVALARSHAQAHPNYKRMRNAFVAFLLASAIALPVLLSTT